MARPTNLKLATSAVLLAALALALAADARQLAELTATPKCNQGKDAAEAIFRFTCDGLLTGYQGVSMCNGTMVCYGSSDVSCTGTPKESCPILPELPAIISDGGDEVVGGGGGGNGVDIPYAGDALKSDPKCNQGYDGAGMIYRYTCDGTKTGSQGKATCNGTMVCHPSFDTSCTKKIVACPGTSGRRA